MVGGDDDQRVLVDPVMAQQIQQPAHHPVGIGGLEQMALHSEAPGKRVLGPQLLLQARVVRAGVQILLPARQVLPGDVRQRGVQEEKSRLAALPLDLAEERLELRRPVGQGAQRDVRLLGRLCLVTAAATEVAERLVDRWQIGLHALWSDQVRRHDPEILGE